jgi:Ankyrin repeats (3 copies)
MHTAAEQLWRVAETGDVDELDRVLLHGPDVNAHNKHGMTALMRAAYHGHEGMARALLQHGADPNLSRNDRFTALALAAFFGHTGTVRILIEHGAKTEVITRCGASAQTWALARTFAEAASCIASHKPVSAPIPVTTPVPTPVTAAPASSIRTLKDPPEIWDLVHEVPKGFNARSAFMSRLKSMRTSVALGVAAVLLVSAACVVGMIVRRGSQARNLPAEASATRSVIGSEVSVPANVEDTSSATAVTPPLPEASELSHHSEAPLANDKRLRKVRQTRSAPIPDEEPAPTIASREEPATSPVTVATPKPEQRKPALSPQLISPTTNAPKAKVIQWP